jgi:hypothetical protein
MSLLYGSSADVNHPLRGDDDHAMADSREASKPPQGKSDSLIKGRAGGGANGRFRSTINALTLDLDGYFGRGAVCTTTGIFDGDAELAVIEYNYT